MNHPILPDYAGMHSWELYAADLMTEYQQCLEEGLDVKPYADLFAAAAKLPMDDIKVRLGDVLSDLVSRAKTVENYPYDEPSDLEGIRALRKGERTGLAPNPDTLESQIAGAWLGRISGCLLGKTVEGIRTEELHPFLQKTGNWPMHRYILKSDLAGVNVADYRFPIGETCYADDIDGMPADDDTNYVVLAQEVISKYGRDFTAFDMSRAWLRLQPKDAYCTAERVAFCNFVKGFLPPASAAHQNPYREWIGAQIRGDYFGYINPGKPELAAEMAFRDASISHIKNGIYGEMFAAAMIAVAACTRDVKEILLGGLGEIPHTSRLYAAVQDVIHAHESGVSQGDCFAMIHARYDEHNGHDWCHTISNAMIVAAALLYGQGDFGKSICMAVETGFDTDCNGATVGSILGMAYGRDHIGEEWTAPLKGRLHTAIFGVGTVNIEDRIKLTLTHL